MQASGVWATLPAAPGPDRGGTLPEAARAV
jgi:hypothetical protein